MSFKFAIPALALAAAVATPAMADVPVYAPVGTVNAQPAFSYTAPQGGKLVVYYLGGVSVGYVSALFATFDNGATWNGPAQASNSDLEGTAYDFGFITAGTSVGFKLSITAPSQVNGNEVFSDPSLNVGGQNLLFVAPWAGGSFTYVDSFFGATKNGSIPVGTYTFGAFEDIITPAPGSDQYPNAQDYDYNDYRFAFRLENVVPEPATWAMMIAGFGLVGFAMRRRKDSLASVSA
jgi:hypothetical protein